jgi:hypothetical protein
MKTINKIALVILTMTSSSVFAAGGASEHSAQSVKHSALAASNGVVASAKTASGVIAVPLKIVGAVGNVSDHAGDSLMENAITTTPLEVSDKTVTAGPPPNEALKKKQPETNPLQEL